jgi:hypothetical protein
VSLFSLGPSAMCSPLFLALLCRSFPVAVYFQRRQDQPLPVDVVSDLSTCLAASMACMLALQEEITAPHMQVLCTHPLDSMRLAVLTVSPAGM